MKQPLILAYLKKKCNVLMNFDKTLYYQTSWQSIRWVLSCYMGSDRQTSKHAYMAQLTGIFSKLQYECIQNGDSTLINYNLSAFYSNSLLLSTSNLDLQATVKPFWQISYVRLPQQSALSQWKALWKPKWHEMWIRLFQNSITGLPWKPLSLKMSAMKSAPPQTHCVL